MKPPTDSQKDLCAKAGQTISSLEFLTKCEEFTDFISSHRRQAEVIAEQILDDDSLSADDRERLRQQRKGILSVIDSPAQDVVANRKMIESYYGKGGDC